MFIFGVGALTKNFRIFWYSGKTNFNFSKSSQVKTNRQSEVKSSQVRESKQTDQLFPTSFLFLLRGLTDVSIFAKK